MMSALLMLLPLIAQPAVDYSAGGASPLAAIERGEVALDFEEEQYKRMHRTALRYVLRGRGQEVVDAIIKVRGERPEDPENCFVLAIAYGHTGKKDKAIELLQLAHERGLPWQRVWSDRTNLLGFLTDDEFAQVAGPPPSPIQHLLRGQLSHEGIAFWARATHAEPLTFTLAISASGNFDAPDATAQGTTSPDRDRTGVASAKGLKPDTEYHYQISADGLDTPYAGTFKTLPAPGHPIILEAGFGGGAGYTPQFEYMWNTILKKAPPVFFLLGDNIYPDSPDILEVVKYCYYRRQARPEFSAFAQNTSVFAIWDDHDFGDNDSWGGPEVNLPAWKIPAWNIFRDNWVNPAYGGGSEQQPGIWFQHSFGDIDVFFLDGRYYRTDPTIPNPSMLGPVQKAWLKDALSKSTATFKVLATPVPFVKGAKPGDGALDTWDGFPAERDEILAHIRENKIEGFFVISADRHRSDVWKMDVEGNYPVWEFESSKLTNEHTHRPEPGSLFSYNEKCSYGHLRFDTTVEDPKVTYTILSIDGETIHEHTLKRSELTFK